MMPEIMTWLERMRARHIPTPGRILEVGSYNVNGTPRDVFQKHSNFYHGVDIAKGPGVDATITPGGLLEHVTTHQLSTGMPMLPFDLVICCEMLEHDINVMESIYQMRMIVAPGGWMIVTSPSHEFPEHQYPRDYWRLMPNAYEDVIFKDWAIVDTYVTPTSPWASSCYLGRKPK
jgi:SAM-dependent methyltransferase